MNWVLKSAFVVAIVGSLAAPLCRAQNPTVGVVLDAESAHVSNGLLTSGTSLYSADVVKTESQGHVQLRISQTRLQLAGQSEAAFFPGASGAVTELRQGTMVFALNTAAESFEVFVSDVRIIPKNERPMLAEVTMKALVISKSESLPSQASAQYMRAGGEIGRATSLPEKKTLRGSGCHCRYRRGYDPVLREALESPDRP